MMAGLELGSMMATMIATIAMIPHYVFISPLCFYISHYVFIFPLAMRWFYYFFQRGAALGEEYLRDDRRRLQVRLARAVGGLGWG